MVSPASRSIFRELLANDELRVCFAIDLSCYNTAHIGSLAATLGGFDELVFTAGIGENAATIREDLPGMYLASA